MNLIQHAYCLLYCPPTNSVLEQSSELYKLSICPVCQVYFVSVPSVSQNILLCSMPIQGVPPDQCPLCPCLCGPRAESSPGPSLGASPLPESTPTISITG